MMPLAKSNNNNNLMDKHCSEFKALEYYYGKYKNINFNI